MLCKSSTLPEILVNEEVMQCDIRKKWVLVKGSFNFMEIREGNRAGHVIVLVCDLHKKVYIRC